MDRPIIKQQLKIKAMYKNLSKLLFVVDVLLSTPQNLALSFIVGVAGITVDQRWWGEQGGALAPKCFPLCVPTLPLPSIFLVPKSSAIFLEKVSFCLPPPLLWAKEYFNFLEMNDLVLFAHWKDPMTKKKQKQKQKTKNS